MMSPPESRDDPPTTRSASEINTRAAPCSRADSAAANPATPDPITRMSTSFAELMRFSLGHRCSTGSRPRILAYFYGPIGFAAREPASNDLCARNRGSIRSTGARVSFRQGNERWRETPSPDARRVSVPTTSCDYGSIETKTPTLADHPAGASPNHCMEETVGKIPERAALAHMYAVMQTTTACDERFREEVRAGQCTSRISQRGSWRRPGSSDPGFPSRPDSRSPRSSMTTAEWPPRPLVTARLQSVRITRR